MNSLERAQKKVEDLKKIDSDIKGVLTPLVKSLNDAITDLTGKAESANKSVKAMITPIIKKLLSIQTKVAEL